MKQGTDTVNQRKYWILFETWWCPICGKEETFQERIYDREKPVEWNDRHHLKEVWDYCDAF